MRKNALLLLLIIFSFTACTKKKHGYTGFVFDQQKNTPLKGVKVTSGNFSTTTDDSGHFEVDANSGSDSIVFKMAGYYTGSFPIMTNHSGEQMEENFHDDRIGLYPVQKNFSTLADYLLSKQPKPLDTGVVYSSANVKQFYKHDNETQDYTLIRPNGYGFEKYYEPIITVKGSNFNYDIGLGADYMKVKNLTINRIPCRVIAYSLPGENDTRIINFQLNSYDNNHHLRDALILDCRFTFEIIYYTDFKIHGDGKISINRYSINRFEQNEQGDLTGEKAKPDTTILHNDYQLDKNGDFIALK